MIIAVDFDGTIVEHRYPEIGEEIPYAIKTLKSLQNLGHTIILWTYRSGEELQEAVDFCKKNGLEFYAVNNNMPDEVYDPLASRKIYADVYIDDRNIVGLPDWLTIFKMINNTEF
jgi:hydroxymethylpyrimidine pyrophosphatase-like HAD family hydrolase